MQSKIDSIGNKFWIIDGWLHLSELMDGTKEYWKMGLRHREDGPAVENCNGNNIYYQHNKLHRVGGPAIEYANGDKSYYQNGELHREDGPAREGSDGIIEYWLNGEQVHVKNNEEFEQYQILQILT